MQRGMLFLLILLFPAAVGCTPQGTNEQVLRQRIVELEEENEQLKGELESIVKEYEKGEEFTFLEGLSDYEFENYNLFLKRR